jgi:hypothetical protein
LDCAFTVQQGVSARKWHLRGLFVVIVPGFNHLERPSVRFSACSDRNTVSTACHPGRLCTQSENGGQFFRPISGRSHCALGIASLGIASRATRITTLRFTRSARAMALFFQPSARRSRMNPSSSRDTWLLARRTYRAGAPGRTSIPLAASHSCHWDMSLPSASDSQKQATSNVSSSSPGWARRQSRRCHIASIRI